MNSSIHLNKKAITINVVVLFLILGLLRLLPFNFYASILVGHDVVIDNKEGNAINFINYLSVITVIIVALIKLPHIKTRWTSLWPFGLFAVLYISNFFFAPYTDPSWVIYQLSFILIASILHLLIVDNSSRVSQLHLSPVLTLFITLCVVFFMFSAVMFFSQNSLSYILDQYNDSFVGTLNSFGVMKQYYGYVAGFIILYACLLIEQKWTKAFVILLVLSTAFGIRSFALGLIGVFLVTSLSHPWRFFFVILFFGFGLFLTWDTVAMELLFDTRFYAYMNALDIINKFPFGVGLGGYPIYTENNNHDLFAAFFTIDAALNYVPNSPESDLVHLFGSLGLPMALIHLFIQLRLIFLGVVHRAVMSPFETFMFFFFVFMTFFGISEDTMFTVSYWIFFGVTSGIIYNVAKRSQYA